MINNSIAESVQNVENRKFIEENLVELKKRKTVRYMLGATVKKNIFLYVMQILFFYVLYMPVFTFAHWFVFRLRIEGKKNIKSIKKNGYVSICNHIHMLDNTFCARGIFPKKPVFTSRASNFEMRGAGLFLKALGVVPTPVNFVETRVFFHCLGELLRSGKAVHFYPEGELIPYDTDLRMFHNGAFHLAVIEQKPIVPMRIVYRARKNPKRKPHMTLVVGSPIFPKTELNRENAIENLKTNAIEVMQGLGCYECESNSN